ncbi:MAG: tetratricopeptide repeat protein [Candidatus Omnitrophota bacterium]
MIAGRRVWVAWIAIAGIAATNTLSILPLKLLNDIGISDRLWTASGIDGHSVGRGDTGLVYAKIEIETLLNESFASPLFKYIGSLLNPPKGPVNWIVEYLNKEAASSDRIKISYDDLPVMFHTNCIVVSAKEVGNPAPEWIVPRRFMKLKADKHYLSETEKFHYDSIRFPVPDVAWDNRPDPLWHRFMPLTDDLAEPLIILRRMGRKTDVGRDSRIASMGSGSDFTKKAKLLNAQGIEYGQSGKIDEAISLFHEAEELDPDYAETYNNLGFAYYRKGDIVRAEEYFSKALEKDPLHEKARVNLDLIRSKKEGL